MEFLGKFKGTIMNNLKFPGSLILNKEICFDKDELVPTGYIKDGKKIVHLLKQESLEIYLKHTFIFMTLKKMIESNGKQFFRHMKEYDCRYKKFCPDKKNSRKIKNEKGEIVQHMRRSNSLFLRPGNTAIKTNIRYLNEDSPVYVQWKIIPGKPAPNGLNYWRIIMYFYLNNVQRIHYLKENSEGMFPPYIFKKDTMEEEDIMEENIIKLIKRIESIVKCKHSYSGLYLNGKDLK